MCKINFRQITDTNELFEDFVTEHYNQALQILIETNETGYITSTETGELLYEHIPTKEI